MVVVLNFVWFVTSLQRLRRRQCSPFRSVHRLGFWLHLETFCRWLLKQLWLGYQTVRWLCFLFLCHCVCCRLCSMCQSLTVDLATTDPSRALWFIFAIWFVVLLMCLFFRQLNRRHFEQQTLSMDTLSRMADARLESVLESSHIHRTKSFWEIVSTI